MTRVYIVDDHAIVRAGLKEIAATASDIEVCGEASGSEGLLGALDGCGCDVVILDVSLGGESGLDLIPRIRAQYPRTRVLVLSMYAEDEYSIRALRLGASGYLTKESAPDELLIAIRRVASGGRFISPKVAERLAERICDPDGRPHERLSARELEILRLIGQGKRLTDIAEICSISVKTVSTHRRRILDKMELSSTAELIRYAIDNRLSI